jgi:hypothetical protein
MYVKKTLNSGSGGLYQMTGSVNSSGSIARRDAIANTDAGKKIIGFKKNGGFLDAKEKAEFLNAVTNNQRVTLAYFSGNQARSYMSKVANFSSTPTPSPTPAPTPAPATPVSNSPTTNDRARIAYLMLIQNPNVNTYAEQVKAWMLALTISNALRNYSTQAVANYVRQQYNPLLAMVLV